MVSARIAEGPTNLEPDSHTILKVMV